MSTILTDDERNRIIDSMGWSLDAQERGDMHRLIQAVLAKLAQQEPVAWIRGNRLEILILGNEDTSNVSKPLYTHPAPQQADRCPECGYLKTQREHLGCLRKAVADLDSATGGPFGAQQADRQRVPEGWIGVVQAARDVLSDAEDHLAKPHSTAVRVALMQLDAMLAAAPEAPAQWMSAQRLSRGSQS